MEEEKKKQRALEGPWDPRGLLRPLHLPKWDALQGHGGSIGRWLPSSAQHSYQGQGPATPGRGFNPTTSSERPKAWHGGFSRGWDTTIPRWSTNWSLGCWLPCFPGTSLLQCLGRQRRCSSYLGPENGAQDSRVWSDPALDITATWGVTWGMKDFLSFSFTPSNIYIFKVRGLKLCNCSVPHVTLPCPPAGMLE